MTNEAGCEFDHITSDVKIVEREKELDDLCAIFVCGIDALRYLLNKAEDAPKTQVITILNSFYIDDNHTTKVCDQLKELWAARETIRAAIQFALDGAGVPTQTEATNQALITAAKSLNNWMFLEVGMDPYTKPQVIAETKIALDMIRKLLGIYDVI
jgi:hypothetical protein